MRIYLAEQNPEIAEALARELKKSKLGCEVATPAAMVDLLNQSRTSFDDFDAVIIGGAEGGADAVAAQIATLRRNGITAVAICLLDFRCVATTVALLRAGADDVLVKPINSAEIAARIEATRRRAHGHATAEITVGRLTAYLDGRDPEVDGRRLRLSHREHAIFTVLALNLGRVVSKERIYESVYGLSDSDPLDKVIDVYICKLRKKIAETTDGGKYIETVYGRGYKLEAPTEDDAAPLIHGSVAAAVLKHAVL